MNAFRVSFLCNANKLGTVLSLLYNEVTDLKMEQEKTTILPKQVNGTSRNHTPRRSPLYDYAVAWCKENGTGYEFHTNVEGELAKALQAGGHKAGNCSPVTTMLVENGIVRRIGKGKAAVI